ncbi:MAG TPA: hypothetical protein K8V32_06180 [Enteractinococcus helveticum]|uniref:Uncharacterized protein n=1 Tax=Enteractinococcus helveticum TaxID=1837282 RepID=A0A921FN79_9MICC|nr:hypothetical protein [Enteractinococcus helveticum]HJF14382.1 hypothetical protein [Enteractinococcus helveticum]
MGNSAGQLAVLAAGYLLGRSKSMKTVLMVAGGVVYGRLTATRDQTNDSSGSLLSGFTSSAIADTARDAITSSAIKGMETLNRNLQNRSEALRGSAKEQSDDNNEADVDDAEATEEETTQATKSGES